MYSSGATSYLQINRRTRTCICHYTRILKKEIEIFFSLRDNGQWPKRTTDCDSEYVNELFTLFSMFSRKWILNVLDINVNKRYEMSRKKK